MAEFLQIDIKSTRSERLVEYLRQLEGNPDHEHLAGEIRAELVLRMQQERGATPKQVVRTVVRNRPKSDWDGIAENWCEAIGLTKDEFLRIAAGKALKAARHGRRR